MSRTHLAMALVAIATLTQACSAPLSTREKGAAIGAVAGGAAGAAVGQAVGHPALGAAIGAAAGTLGGWVVGDQIGTRRQRDQAQAEAARARATAQAPLPPVTQTYQAGDPTSGAFVNATPWTVVLTVSPAGADGPRATLSLGPRSSAAHALDVGQYHVRATATVHTQFGPRTVGHAERAFAVDPRGQGWRVEFGPYDFR